MFLKNEDLVNHISKLVMHIEDKYGPDSNQQEALANFEKLSSSIKKFSTKKCFSRPASHIMPQIVAEKEENNSKLQDFIEDNEKILSRVGLGFSYRDSLFFADALNRFNQVEQADFEVFGKVYGLGCDYYVIYAYKPMDSKKQVEKEYIEKEGEGVNAYIVYIATSQQNSDWVKLPLLNPEQVRQARRFKSVFKGDLSHNLNKQGFNGTEAHYLKAQLVRLLSGSRMAQKGIFTLNEETGKEEVDQEAIKELRLSKEDASNFESFVYRYTNILKSGRTTHFIPSHRNEEEADELKEKLEEKDPKTERFQSINESDQTSWEIKKLGNFIESFTEMKDGETNENSQCFVIFKNKMWEGSYNIFCVETQRMVFFYKGFGLKKTQPVLPKENLTYHAEPKQKEEHIEPNHVEEPVEEKDEAEEGEEGEGEENNDADEEAEN